MYLTFDVGTTSVKTVLYDRNGNVVYKVTKDYSLDSPRVDWYEVDPRIYWNSVCSGFREILDKSGIKASEIKTISGCSQGETVIFLDEKDEPLRPAIVWYDNRARDEVRELKSFLNEEEFYRTTGLVEMDTTWTAPKILWVKNNEPSVFEKAAKIMLVEDYIIYKLTGCFVSSVSLLTSTALVDILKGGYWSKTVDYLGTGKKLPKIIKECSVVGNLKPDVRDDLGFDKKLLVIKGSMDQTTGAVGAGNIKPGIITETTGSALAIAITTDRFLSHIRMRLPHQYHVLDGKYLILPYAATAGITYKWFRDSFAKEDIKRVSDPEKVYDELNKIASSVPPGSEGLVFLPFLSGASFPENDSYARGVFYGLTLKHGKAHFARAIMESIGYMLKKILTCVEKSGISIQEIHSMGGGARSPLWLQIKADICGYPIVKMKVEEAATLGAAIIASVKVGDYPDIEEAVENMVKKDEKYIPKIENKNIYLKAYTIYNDLYNCLKLMFRKYQ